MRFDDRLVTVLDQPAADAHGQAVQWRQLVELMARGAEISPHLRHQALTRIAQQMQKIPADLLEATARAIAGPSVPAELVVLFAARGASASAALLAAANLDAAGWSAVRAAAADDVLPLLTALAPMEGTPAPQGTRAPQRTPAPQRAPQGERLEQWSRSVDRQSTSAAPPAGLFRWETGPTGEIDWVKGAPRSALVGRNLADEFAGSFAARLPFADEPMMLGEEGALAGEWRWSGAPAFFPDTGRFAGYRGVARREGSPPESLLEPGPIPDDGLRELMHELRTPLNAIIGFGEIIDGQYLGPAHRAYRERAAEIVYQARILSDAVDNLDVAARFRSGRMQGPVSSDLTLIREVLEDAEAKAKGSGVGLRIDDRAGNLLIALPPALAERLTRQFISSLVQSGKPGERLHIVLDRIETFAALAIDRASALQGLPEYQILDDQGRVGTRFELRLVQGLARMIGGRLDIGAERLVLLFPLVD